MTWRVFIESPIFTKLVGDYLDDDEYSKLQTHLLKSPKAGDDTISGPVLKKIKEAMKK